MNKPIHFGTRLCLHCLGHLRLQDFAGSDLTPRTRKARALLAYLALTDRPSSRERLADLMWSDRGPEQARSSFRQAIYELRHLTGEDAAITAPQPDEVALNSEVVTTDLAAIRRAAEADDFERLEALLDVAGSGLLTDLDGLDPEFDTWLRIERAHEPSATFGVALGAASRSFETLGPQSAKSLVAQIQRLDPGNEVAARLAFRIAHQLGDRSSLHRNFEQLRRRLKSEFDSEPSPETVELFEQLAGEAPRASRTDLPVEIGTVAEAEPALATSKAERRRWRWLVPVAGLAAIGGVIAWRQQAEPAPPAEAPLVAVLPFDQQSDTSPALAEGLWDDTRLALSQNGTVRVLGRTTSLALDEQRLTPQLAGKRLGVDYLLEGGVRSQGERVRIVVSLTRATDGLSVWEKSFEGRVGDAMSLQAAVASGIEGHIRGRLAPGGGTIARQISTSPEVYKLYTEARSLIRRRGMRDITAAAVKLRQAVTLDPNFAPAWASLASTARINRHAPQGLGRDQQEGITSARRAIELAPNLAEAHAALAFVQGMHLPSSERLLKRAIELDPSNSEAWNWLGNNYAYRAMQSEAIAAWEQAVKVDPLFASPAANLLEARLARGERRAGDQLIDRIAAAQPSSPLVTILRADTYVFDGDYSQAVEIFLSKGAPRVRLDGNESGQLGNALIRLNYADEAARLWSQREWFGPVLRGERLPPERIDGQPIGARDFWLAASFGVFASRAMLLQDRPDLLVRRYREGFASRDDFVASLEANNTLVLVAPNIAVALRRTGNEADAVAILAAAEQLAARRLANAPADRFLQWDIARIHAQQGRRAEALNAIVRARRAGWLPDGMRDALDIGREPAFVPLRGDPRFEAIRREILAHIAKERKELGPVRL